MEGCTLMSWSLMPKEYQREARESRAASLICHVLLINAWRRRREEVVQLRADLAGVVQQLDHLQIQIVVLRRLLDNENARVVSLAGELHKAKAQNEEVAKERDSLKSVMSTRVVCFCDCA